MKKNSECCLVTDLLPLYIDHLVSAESAQLVQSHLENCKECTAYYQRLLEDRDQTLQMEKQKSNGMAHLLRRYRNEMLGLALGISFMVLFLIINALIFSFNDTDEQTYSIEEHYSNTSDYGSQNYTGLSGLALFPDSNAMNGNIVDFYYDCKGQRLYQEYQIYLKVQYNAADYQSEKDRLLNVKDDDTGLLAYYTEEEFCMPGIYAMLYDEGYEYALFSDEEQAVIYIYLQGIDRRNLYFDKNYLPCDYGQYGLYFETERAPYSIYPDDIGGF